MAAEMPSNVKISNDAKRLMQELTTEFILFTTSEACSIARARGQRIISADVQTSSLRNTDLDVFLPRSAAANTSNTSGPAVRNASAREDPLSMGQIAPELPVARQYTAITSVPDILVATELPFAFALPVGNVAGQQASIANPPFPAAPSVAATSTAAATFSPPPAPYSALSSAHSTLEPAWPMPTRPNGR